MSPESSVRVLRFQRQLRLIEYLTNCRPAGTRIALAILWRVHARQAERLGFTVPPNTFGAGLCLVHPGTIVVNEMARIGCDARVHPSTSIGRNAEGAPTLGHGCYIGPGARLIGPITLGSHVIVGANAVVLESFPDHSVLVGVPAACKGWRETRADIH